MSSNLILSAPMQSASPPPFGEGLCERGMGFFSSLPLPQTQHYARQVMEEPEILNEVIKG